MVERSNPETMKKNKTKQQKDHGPKQNIKDGPKHKKQGYRKVLQSCLV